MSKLDLPMVIRFELGVMRVRFAYDSICLTYGKKDIPLPLSAKSYVKEAASTVNHAIIRNKPVSIPNTSFSCRNFLNYTIKFLVLSIG